MKHLLECHWHLTLVDKYLIRTLKNDISKLFDRMEKYDDGDYYFDEKVEDLISQQGPLSASSSMIWGLTDFAEVTSESLNR